MENKVSLVEISFDQTKEYLIQTANDLQNDGFDTRGARSYFKELKGTENYRKLLNYYLENYEDITSQIGGENGIDNISDRNKLLGIVFSGIETDLYSDENLDLSIKIAQTVDRLLIKGSDDQFNNELADDFINRPIVGGFQDLKLLVLRGMSNLQDTEAGRRLGGFMIVNSGLSMIIDHYREIYYNENLNQLERDSAYKYLLKFWQAAVGAETGSVVVKDVADFYNKVPDELHPMTEAKEGDQSVAFLLKTFPEVGIIANDTIVDVACGKNAWLTRRLKNQGYTNVIGVDNNPKLIDEAIKEGIAIEGDMLDLCQVLEENDIKPKAIIIKGRSIQHIRRMDDMDEFNAPVVIFDALDPNTGVMKQRLDNIRSFLKTEHSLDGEFLKDKFWTILGKLGDNLMNRFCPPPDWWTLKMEGKGYNVRVVTEYNYDGLETDNKVFVCTKSDNPVLNRNIGPWKDSTKNGIPYAKLGY